MRSETRLILMITTVIVNINCHKDIDTSDSFYPSDDMEREEIRRNIINDREWQYEGLPIDLPSRGIADTTKAKSKKDTMPTTTVNPPNNRRYRRIYDADEMATIQDHPYLAALLVNDQLWCGAVVLDTDTILTAAHCLQLQYNNRFFREYIKMLNVRVGSTNATSGGEVFRVTEIFFHPNYKPNTLEFNFALLKIHKNISFDNPNVRVANIDYSTDKTIPPDSKITFLGWGSVVGIGGHGGHVLLQKVELPVYDLADCQEIYGRELVTRNNFCAGYITVMKNVCNHDAGGPAILGDLLVGILSFSSKRCDVPDQPAVFSTVGIIVPWLEGLREKTFKTTNTEIKSSDWANVRE